MLQYLKDRSSTPSNFTLKLRKHLRTRRLTEVRQLGLDRIVDFTFGSGDTAHHLLLELYSQVIPKQLSQLLASQERKVPKQT